MALVALAVRFGPLREQRVRLRLVVIAAAGYAGLVGLVTWQALRGQALIHPDGLTLGSAAALVGAVLVAAAVAFRAPGPRRPKQAPVGSG
jgi:hypothetical protein